MKVSIAIMDDMVKLLDKAYNEGYKEGINKAKEIHDSVYNTSMRELQSESEGKDGNSK